MRKNRVLQVLAALFLLSIMTTLFDFKPVFAQGTIYIRPDGTVDPSTAAIQRFNDLYTFTADIYDSVVIQKDSIIVDGNGYRLQGTGTGNGVELISRVNVTIMNLYIADFGNGIRLLDSRYNKFFDNTITLNAINGASLENSPYNALISNVITHNGNYGLSLFWGSTYETVQGNTIADNYAGTYMFQADGDFSGNLMTGNTMHAVYFETSHGDNFVGNIITNNYGGITGYDLGSGNIRYNVISNNSGFGMDINSPNYENVIGNIIQGNGHGISFYGNLGGPNNVFNNTVAYNDIGFMIDWVEGNKIYRNNFVHNTKQVYDPSIPYEVQVWDNGYPLGGNFWSDYEGTDYYSGPYQNLTGSDGIGDVPYLINAWETWINKDNYPFMSTISTPPSALTITATTGGATDPSLGAHVYTVGSVATISAIPQTNYMFDHWELDNTNIGSANPLSVTIDTNHALHAVFKAKPALIITATTGGTTDPPPGIHTDLPGSVIPVTALPQADYLFDHWELDNVNIGSANPVAITMDANHALHATFRLIPDIAVTAIQAHPTNVRLGEPVEINVTVGNLNGSAETFDVVVFADKDKTTVGDEIIIGTQTVYYIVPGATKILLFTWDTSTTPSGTGYYISAEAVATYDRDPSNNLLTQKKKVTIRH